MRSSRSLLNYLTFDRVSQCGKQEKNFAHRSVGSSIYRISNGLSVYRSIAFQSIVLLRASCPRGEKNCSLDLATLGFTQDSQFYNTTPQLSF